jgi:hypothetical protein
VSALDSFARQLAALEEAPEPYRGALRGALPSGETYRWLVFGPAFRTLRQFSPTTLLALTERRWALAAEQPQGGCAVSTAEFDQTLAVELTEILLYGQLRIQWAAGGETRWVGAHFNTVMRRLYHRAVEGVLDGVDAAPPTAEMEPWLTEKERELLQPLPFKFYNATALFRPTGQRLGEVLHRPAVVRRRLRFLEQELVPEGVLARTDRTLVLISEDKAWSWLQLQRQGKHGNVVTYCSLSRVAEFRVHAGERFVTLELRLKTARGGGTATFDVPRSQREAVTRLLDRAMRLSAAGARVA